MKKNLKLIFSVFLLFTVPFAVWFVSGTINLDFRSKAAIQVIDDEHSPLQDYCHDGAYFLPNGVSCGRAPKCGGYSGNDVESIDYHTVNECWDHRCDRGMCQGEVPLCCYAMEMTGNDKMCPSPERLYCHPKQCEKISENRSQNNCGYSIQKWCGELDCHMDPNDIPYIPLSQRLGGQPVPTQKPTNTPAPANPSPTTPQPVNPSPTSPSSPTSSVPTATNTPNIPINPPNNPTNVPSNPTVSGDNPTNNPNTPVPSEEVPYNKRPLVPEITPTPTRKPLIDVGKTVTSVKNLWDSIYSWGVHFTQTILP